MCKILGLRYAPEIRFYRDNTLDQLNQRLEEAAQYLEEARKEEMEKPRNQMVMLLVGFIFSNVSFNYYSRLKTLPF